MYKVRCRKCKKWFLWTGERKDIKDCIYCHSSMVDIAETVQVSIDDNVEEEAKE